MQLRVIVYNFLSSFFKIIEVLNALETFSVLSRSKIEGIEAIASKFNHIYSALKKKPYDPLDHRRPDFVVDFAEFKRQITELEVRIDFLFSFSLKCGQSGSDIRVSYHVWGLTETISDLYLEHHSPSLIFETLQFWMKSQCTVKHTLLFFHTNGRLALKVIAFSLESSAKVYEALVCQV